VVEENNMGTGGVRLKDQSRSSWLNRFHRVRTKVHTFCIDGKGECRRKRFATQFKRDQALLFITLKNVKHDFTHYQFATRFDGFVTLRTIHWKDLVIMKAITIHAPWAWAIIHGHKRFENRTWRTQHRGLLAIHAGNSRSSDQQGIKTIRSAGIEPPTIEELDAIRGKIVGTVELADIISLEDAPDADPFVSGPFCFVLVNPIRYANPKSAQGKLRIWATK
jgi:hypothetical protein